MTRSRLEISPSVLAELDRVREAAEYAASHPVEGGMKIATIRGYQRIKGRWIVEALEADNPNPLPLDGLTLVQIVEEAKLRERFSDDISDEDIQADNPSGDYETAISREGVSLSVRPPANDAAGGHTIPSGQNPAEAGSGIRKDEA